jgi:hypothetical protein
MLCYLNVFHKLLKLCCMFFSGWFNWHLYFKCQHFGTLSLFHLHRRVGMNNIVHTYPPIKMEQSVPKRWYFNYRRRRITQKKQTTFRTRRKFKVTLFKVLSLYLRSQSMLLQSYLVFRKLKNTTKYGNRKCVFVNFHFNKWILSI